MSRESPEKILFSAEQIAEKVRELGARITKDYAGKSLVLLSVLKGSLMEGAGEEGEIFIVTVKQYE